MADLWLSPALRPNLLGNARPKTFAKLLDDDDYWFQVFEGWIINYHNDASQQDLLSLFTDLRDYKSGAMGAEALRDNWFTGDGRTTLADKASVAAVAEAFDNDGDVAGTVDTLYDSIESQFEMVYESFYEDVGEQKDLIRRGEG